MGKHPKMLYHYCSLDTFLKIITSGKIWLSDVRKSNDKQELRHLKSECAIQLLTAQNEYLERYSEEEGFTYDFKAMEEINSLAEKITTADLFVTWAFCLSEEYDLLSQCVAMLIMVQVFALVLIMNILIRSTCSHKMTKRECFV